MIRVGFWLPLASLLGVEVYARGFDGWGAWATAPLFVLPFCVALMVSAVGAYEAVCEYRHERLRRSTMLVTAVAAFPIFWLLVRRYFV